MAELKDYEGQSPAWCPGCGNFPLLKTFKQAMLELGLEPHQFLVVSGIGQAGKLPHYTKCNTFNGLHGRTLPVGTAARLVNNKLPVIAVAGDGDCYGEGGNHFIHAIRRNMNIKLFVHDNQIYALTKGQASPTTGEGMVTKSQPFGVFPEPLNPIALAISLHCTFVARGFVGDADFLKDLMKQAIEYKGFALLDIFQPCVIYNKVNTYKWYKERVYRVGPEHDPTDRMAAMKLALEFGEKIPTGVIYKCERPLYEERYPTIVEKPLIEQEFKFEEALKELETFY